jgi:hypothetical protein
VDRGYRPGTIARSMVQGVATRFPAQGQLAVIRPYRKNILGGGEEKVRFDIFSEDSQTYVVKVAMRLRQSICLLNSTGSMDTAFDSTTIRSTRRS